METINFNVFTEIASKLSPTQISNLCRTNKLFASYCARDNFWQTILSLRYPGIMIEEHNYRDEYRKLYKLDQELLSYYMFNSNIIEVENILQRGIDLNQIIGLFDTAIFSSREIVKMLLDYGLKISSYSLRRTIMYFNRFDLVKLFIKYGVELPADFTELILFSKNCSDDYLDILDSLPDDIDVDIMDSTNKTPLINAILSNCARKVDILLDRGANPSLNQAYKIALIEGNTQIIKLLDMYR